MDACGDLFYYVEQFKNQPVIGRLKFEQRSDVTFWDDDDVRFPVRAGVVIGKYVPGLKDPLDRCLAA